MTKKIPFFSVVIPLYNKADYILETIMTVLNQTFQDFEVVIVDDGSSDASYEKAQTIDDNRIKIVQQNNSGVSVARNRGIREAESEYIVFLDADDLWLPEFLETIFKLINNYPKAGLYATAYEMKDKDKIRKLKMKNLPSEYFEGILPNYFKSIVMGDNLVWTSAVCIPRKIFYEYDIWFPIGEARGEDQFVWARIALEFDIAYSSKVCAIYKLYTANSTSATECNFIKPRKFLLSLKKYKNIKNNEDLNIWLDKFLEKEIFNTIKRNITNGRRIYAIKQMFSHEIEFKYKIKILIYFITPFFVYSFFKQIKNNVFLYKPKHKIKG